MYQYTYDENFFDFPDFELINKYQLDQNMIGLSKVGFKIGYDLKPNQEILHLKYQAVTFNLYGSMYMFIHFKNNKDNAIGLMYLQSSNNFLQSSWDCLFQMINMFNLEIGHAEKLIKDENKRIATEKKLKVYDYMVKHKNDEYIQNLKNLYDSKMKLVRNENNYVKHNGHVSAEANRKEFKAGRIDLKTGESEIINQNLYRERGININKLSKDILECINKVLEFLNKYMEDHIDDLYKHLILLSNEVQKR